MLPTDLFRARFDQTVASLRAWTGFIADVARIEVAENEQTWRLRLQPHVATGAPCELMLRRDQLFDITIADETYEDLPIGDLDRLLPLLEAISEGRVVTRTRASPVTGLTRSVETRAMLADGSIWREERMASGGELVTIDDAVVSDRCYTPYRR